jgi:hypothetical protein
MVDSFLNVFLSICNFSTKSAFVILKAPVAFMSSVSESFAANMAWAVSVMIILVGARAISV